VTDFEELIFADTAAMLAAEEFAEDIVYRRPSAGGVERTIRGITEIGDLSRMKDIRTENLPQRRTGRLYVADTALADFGGAAEYRDEVDINGQTWTVLSTISEEYGLIELLIERDVRPAF